MGPAFLTAVTFAQIGRDQPKNIIRFSGESKRQDSHGARAMILPSFQQRLKNLIGYPMGPPGYGS